MKKFFYAQFYYNIWKCIYFFCIDPIYDIFQKLKLREVLKSCIHLYNRMQKKILKKFYSYLGGGSRSTLWKRSFMAKWLRFLPWTICINGLVQSKTSIMDVNLIPYMNRFSSLRVWVSIRMLVLTAHIVEIKIYAASTTLIYFCFSLCRNYVPTKLILQLSSEMVNQDF